MDISPEIWFKTARSGGKGGQNVNKVETMVEGYWDINSSSLLSEDQKARLKLKLANKINAGGYLLVKSQTERSQLGNKEKVVKKMNVLVNTALIIPKKRNPQSRERLPKKKDWKPRKKPGKQKRTGEK